MASKVTLFEKAPTTIFEQSLPSEIGICGKFVSALNDKRTDSKYIIEKNKITKPSTKQKTKHIERAVAPNYMEFHHVSPSPSTKTSTKTKTKTFSETLSAYSLMKYLYRHCFRPTIEKPHQLQFLNKMKRNQQVKLNSNVIRYLIQLPVGKIC